MPDTTTARHLIRCDCCGTCGLATIVSGVQKVELEIRARRHGIWHNLVLDMEALAQFDVTEYCVCSDQQRR